MASSVFLGLGLGTTITVSGIYNADGTAAAPSYSYAADTDTGQYRIGANNEGFSAGGTLRWDYNTTRILSTLPIQTPAGASALVALGIGDDNTGFYSSGSGRIVYVSNGTDVVDFNGNTISILDNNAKVRLGASSDVVLAWKAANALALRNGTNPQTFCVYGYSSGSREAYGCMVTVTSAVTLSGASTATGNIIPAGCFVVGVATSTTTTITGASGYQVGDGSDADRWGDITGTAVGTHSDNTNSTANPTGYVAAASAVTLTAKTSNFTGGVVQVTVAYLTTGSA